MEFYNSETHEEMNKNEENKEGFGITSKYTSMISYDDIHIQYIISLIKKTQVMRLKQMIKFVSKKFGFSETKAEEYIYESQKFNYLIVTKDGFVMTNGFYVSVTEDIFFDGLTYNNYLYHYERPIRSKILNELPTINCYTVVASMMPVSEDFFIPNTIWNVMFVTPQQFVKENSNGCLYEIIYIPHKTATAFCYALEQSWREKPEEVDGFIKRIAVLENKEDASKVPYIGFTKIVTVDKDEFTLIEDRGENPWGY